MLAAMVLKIARVNSFWMNRLLIISLWFFLIYGQFARPVKLRETRFVMAFMRDFTGDFTEVV